MSALLHRREFVATALTLLGVLPSPLVAVVARAAPAAQPRRQPVPAVLLVRWPTITRIHTLP